MVRYFVYNVDSEEELLSIYDTKTLQLNDSAAEIMDDDGEKISLISFKGILVAIGRIVDFDGVQVTAKINWSSFYYIYLDEVSPLITSALKNISSGVKMIPLPFSTKETVEIVEDLHNLRKISWEELHRKLGNNEQPSSSRLSSASPMPSSKSSDASSRCPSCDRDEDEERNKDNDDSSRHNRRHSSRSRSISSRRSHHSHSSSSSNHHKMNRSRSRDRSDGSPLHRSDTVDTTLSTTFAEESETAHDRQSPSIDPELDTPHNDHNRSRTSTHHSKSTSSKAGGSAGGSRRTIDFDVTNLTYDQYCAEHYVRAIDAYRRERYERELSIHRPPHQPPQPTGHPIMSSRGPVPLPPAHPSSMGGPVGAVAPHPPHMHHMHHPHAPQGYPTSHPMVGYGNAPPPMMPPQGAPGMMYPSYPQQPPAPLMR